MFISMLLKTQENVVAKWTKKKGRSSPHEKQLYFKTGEWLYKNNNNKNDGDLKPTEEKVSLLNALPPPLDLLAPPRTEAPQLSFIYTLAELRCIKQGHTQDSTCNAN